MSEPALGQQRKFEPRVLAARNADIGGRQQNVEPCPCRPAVDCRDDRLPDPRIMVAHPPVDPGLLTMHRAGQRPENPLWLQILALLLGDVWARRQIVPATEVAVARAGQDRTTDISIFPEIDPSR